MEMGIPILMGFPRDSHGNGNSFELLMEMGMGIVLMGIGIAYFKSEKNKIPIVIHRQYEQPAVYAQLHALTV